MGRRVWIVVLCLIFGFAAVLVIVLPLLEKHIGQARSNREVLLYREEMDTMEQDWMERQKALARWYNFTLCQSPENPELDQFYSRVGAASSGMVGYLEVEEPGLRLAVYGGRNSGKAAAWHAPDSAFPLGIPGDRTVVILAQEEMLSRLKPGMEVRAGFLGEEITLRVLEPGQGGSLVLKGEVSGLEVHCGNWTGPLPGKNSDEKKLCIAGTLGAWTLAAAAGLLGKALQSEKRKQRKKQNDQRKLSGKAKKPLLF